MSVRSGVLTVALAAGVTLAASPAASQTLSGGGLVGMSIGDLSFADGTVESSRKGGFAAGGFVDLMLTEGLSVQPQLLFVQRGARIIEGGRELTLKLDALEVPLLARVTLPRAGGVRPFLQAGPVFARNVSATADLVGTPDVDGLPIAVTRNELALTVGAGLTVDGLLVEGRYTHGLTGLTVDDQDDVRTRAFLFLAGFHFPTP